MASTQARGTRRGLLVLACLCVLAVAAFLGSGAPSALAAGDANTPSCAEFPGTESSPGFRAYLPDCRAYELVSPPYKEGGRLQFEPAALSADGENLIVGIAGASGGIGNLPYDPNRVGDIGTYRLQRTDAGWRYTALTPPATQYEHSALLAVSADPTLSATLWGAQVGRAFYHQEDIYMQGPGGALSRVGPGKAPGVAGQEELAVSQTLSLAGASDDLTRSLFSVQAETSGGNSDLWPGDTTQNGRHSLYEYVYRGAESSEPMLVGVVNQGPLAANTEAQLISSCGTQLGAAQGGSAYNAVSADGETIFFTALEGGCKHEGSPPGTGPPVNELYARLGGSQTVAISEPTTGPAGDCDECDETGKAGAEFQGASKDGSRVFFTTEQELLQGQTGNNLYEYDFEGPAHKRISLSSTGSSSPEVQGVVRVSPDGSHVYFVAKGVLTTGNNAEGKAPQLGADNLYLHDTATESTAFVATLLTEAEETTLQGEEGAEASLVAERAEHAEFAAFEEAFSKGASFEEAFTKAVEAFENALRTLPGTLGPSGTLAMDRSVWQTGDRRPAQATSDGRFLVFPSSADLTAGDTSKVPQLFEYDAESQRLTRVSIGEGGAYSDNGNVGTFHDAPQIPVQQFEAAASNLPTAPQLHLAVSADGSQVFFTSAAPLTPTAVSGAPSVFEYREGDVYLLSDGQDTTDTGIGTSSVEMIGADPSGRDLLFTTASLLVPRAADTQQSLYDARAAGGFPAPAAPAACSGEACQGAISPPSPNQAAGSAAFSGPGNQKPRHHKKHHRNHKRHAKRGDHNRDGVQ